MQTTGAAAPRRRGVVGHRAALAPEDIWRVGPVALTGPTRTVVDLASLSLRSGVPLLSDDDLVVLLDGLIDGHLTGPRAVHRPLRTPTELAADLARMVHVRGVGRVRRAAERALPAVDSALETRMRLMLERHGLTGWATDVELRPAGHRTVWPDLADREHRLCLQVEGPHHDEYGQRERDIARARATTAAGWKEIRLSSRDMVADRWSSSSVPPAVALVRAARAASRCAGEPATG